MADKRGRGKIQKTEIKTKTKAPAYFFKFLPTETLTLCGILITMRINGTGQLEQLPQEFSEIISRVKLCP